MAILEATVSCVPQQQAPRLVPLDLLLLFQLLFTGIRQVAQSFSRLLLPHAPSRRPSFLYSLTVIPQTGRIPAAITLPS